VELAKLLGVIGYLAILLGIGVVASRRMKDLKDYFAAGKDLGFFSVAFSARATGESAWLLLGLTGMGAAIGAKAFWVVLGEVLGVAGAWLLLSRRFHRLTTRYDSITVPDYLESRFGDTSHRIRIVAAFALTVFVTIYVSAQIDATGKAFESFLGWNYFAGIAVGFAVVVAYITTGGFLAVVWSDVFQGTLMFLGLVILPVVAIGAAGGWGAVTSGLTAISPDLMSATGGTGWTPVATAEILGLALIGLGFLGSPQIFVRFIALRDESEIRKGTAVALIWTLLADSGAVLIGMVGRVALSGPGGDMGAFGGAEAVLPALVEYTFPAVLVGLYIAIVLSAIMSTVDSLLVVAGSAAVRDWYQKVRHPELSDQDLLGLSRKATFGLAVMGLAVALGVALSTPDRTIFWFVIFGWRGIAATFCPVIILSLYWPRMTGRGALAAMITGFLGVPLFKFLAPKLPVVGEIFGAMGELPPAFGLAFLVAVLVSLADVDGVPEAAAQELEEARA